MLAKVKQFILSLTTTDDFMHITAHFGATYVITHLISVSALLLTPCKFLDILLGLAVGNAINCGRKALQGFPGDTKRAAYAGLAGSVLAAILFLVS